MTMGSENLSNGSATAQDRFSGGVSAYRQGRREAGFSSDGDNELGSRSGGNSGLPTRSPGRSHSIDSHSIDSHSIDAHSIDAHSIDSHSIEPTGVLDRAPQLPSLDLPGLSDSVFPSSGWPDAASSQSMADHPLLRGLLMELPARGTLPPSDWLDRWFEAARSILELLYVQEARKG
jgi:hypothetical protein